MNKNTLIIVLIALFTIFSCREKIDPQADDFVEYGWTLYGERSFRHAFEVFQEGLNEDSLYIDGYNGAGWCYVEFNSPDTAISFFSDGLDYIAVDSSQIRFEMLAGLSLSYHAAGDYPNAILKGTELYSLEPTFGFTHDWRIDYVDIVLLLAMSHYAQGEFAQSLTWVQILDDTFVVDVSTNEGRADLVKMIETIQNQ
jgi:tetratricopeptide (TPR) repeat protein